MLIEQAVEAAGICSLGKHGHISRDIYLKPKAYDQATDRVLHKIFVELTWDSLSYPKNNPFWTKLSHFGEPDHIHGGREAYDGLK